MILPVTAPEHVADLLNQWYIQIQQNRFEESGRTKREIEGLLDGMDEDQTVLLYYSLLDYRYQCRFKENGHTDESVSDSLDAILTYYFYFYKGMHAFKIRAYDEAFESYQQAEKYLEEVTDVIEKGEFYYKVASLYYHIYKTESSLELAKKALAIFEKDPHYTKRTAHSHIIIALNLISLREFLGAEDHLNKAWKTAVAENDEGLKYSVCHNLSLLYRDKGQPESSIKWTLESIKYKEPNEKTLYLLAEAACELNQQDFADEWIKKGIDYSQNSGHREYWHRFRILKVRNGAYHPNLFENVLREAIQFFKQEKLWDCLAKYTPYLIEFLEGRNRVDEIKEYKQLVLLAQENLIEFSHEY